MTLEDVNVDANALQDSSVANAAPLPIDAHPLLGCFPWLSHDCSLK